MTTSSWITGRYELVDELGRGASGTVYRATDHALGREVALKLLHVRPNGDAARRFAREVKVASSLDHPGVISVFDVGEHDGQPYYVMELVRSPCLERLISGPAGAAAATAIGRQLAALLDVAHTADVIHRDVKPANIFIEGPIEHPTRCRLGDFGLAFMATPAQPTLGRFTVDDIMLGTPSYMAPEQAAGGDIGPAVDVYSLGCILHELVTGRPPFVGDLARVIAGHQYLPPIALSDFDPDISRELSDVVMAMLDKLPAQRPTARELAATLAAISPEPKPGSLAMTRAERSIGSATPEPATGCNDIRVAIQLGDASASLEAALEAAGVEVHATADIVIVPFGHVGNAALHVWVHDHPGPEHLAQAIRAGANAVIRWPGPITPIRAHLARLSRRILRVPSG